MHQENTSLFHAFEHLVWMNFIHAVRPVMVACSLATPSLAAVIPVPNGSFEILYQPGSTTITADTGGGWTHGVGPGADMEGDVATYSDSTTGTDVDIPGWVNATGWLPSYDWPSGCGVVSRGGSAQDGSYYYAANGTTWGNNNGGAIESDTSLATVVSGETYTLSVYATDWLSGKVLDLLADGVALTPDASSDTPAGDWTKTTKTYSAASLASHVGKSLKVRVGWAAGATGGQAKLDNVSLTAFADSTPPTLTSFVDNQGGFPVVEYRPVTYTLTFSEVMNASTIGIDDFDNNDVNTDLTINSVAPTGDPAVFIVTVTPTEAGTLHLRIKAGTTLKDTAGNNLDTSSAIFNDTPIVVLADTDAPTLTSFADDKNGGPVVINQTVTYTVTFDEAMNGSTVDASDFGNAYATTTTIDSVAPTLDPKVFLVQATPGAAGTLQLRINPGASLTDLKGNAMVTGSGIPDDTTIVVNAPPSLVCPLGVLNLSANGGINPATGNLWQAGDKYRLIFVSSGTTSCDSTDISTYNAFVQGLANASTVFPALGSVTWKVVGSTATVDARDNTGTNPGVNGTGEPVFRMDGSFAIATNYGDLWNGIVATHVTGQNYLAVHLDENGVERIDERVRTGTSGNGTAAGDGRALGGSAEAPPRVQTGRNYAPDFYGAYGATGWMQDWSEEASSAGRVYALSEPITLQVAPSNTFTAWANGNNAANQTPGQDHDYDGVPNGIEYFMGETGSAFTAMPSLDGSNTIAWTMDPNYQGTYEVQTSPDLDHWTNVAPRPEPSGGVLSYTLPTGAPGGKNFVRLLVTPAP